MGNVGLLPMVQICFGTRSDWTQAVHIRQKAQVLEGELVRKANLLTEGKGQT